ncbi:MAG: hypothetical protein GY769_04390 [bacterium]|nr:hypothetical protein [bacterium]
MIDFGALNDHGAYIRFDPVEAAYMDGFRGMIWAARVNLADEHGTWGYLMGKTDHVQGWAIRFDFANYQTKPEMVYEDLGGTARYHRCQTAMSLLDWYSLVFAWAGSNRGRWYLNGVFQNETDSESDENGTIWNNKDIDLHICGSGGATDRGAAVRMDNVVVFPGAKPTDEEADRFAADYHAGNIAALYTGYRIQGSRERYPGVHTPLFWWPGDFTPGENVVSHELGGQEQGEIHDGTPTAVEDDCDSPSWTVLNFGSASTMSAGAPASSAPEGKMPDAMYAEVTGRNNTYVGVQVEFPDNTMGFATASLPTSEEFYRMKAQSIGNVKRQRSDKSGKLQPVEANLVLLDHRRELSRLLTGVLDGKAEGSPARIRLLSPDVDAGSWMTVFDGSLKRWTPRGSIPEITLTLAPDDLVMRSDNKIGFITRDLYPNLPDEMEDVAMKAIYGSFDSIVGGGPIACEKVNTNGKQYFVSVGQSWPLQTYQGGTMLDPRAESNKYTIAVPVERNGRWLTEVYPATDAGDNAITVDVDGASVQIATSYAGAAFSGFWRNQRPIMNPAEQILHFMINHLFGSYERGAWLSPESGGRIDVASFIEAAGYFRQRGIKGRTIVYSDETGYQVLNRWSGRWNIPIFWDSMGRVAARIDRHDVRRGTQPHLVGEMEGVSNLVTTPKEDMLADQVKVRHGYDWVGEKFVDTTRAMDLSQSWGVTHTMEQDWSAT